MKLSYMKNPDKIFRHSLGVKMKGISRPLSLYLKNGITFLVFLVSLQGKTQRYVNGNLPFEIK